MGETNFTVDSMRILVTGSKEFYNSALVFKAIAQAVRLHFYGDNSVSKKELEKKFPLVTIVSGGAKGAEEAAIEFGKRNGMRIETHYADWETYETTAAPRRNKEMVYSNPKPDICLAFIADDTSRGTKKIVEMARKRGILVLEIPDI